MSRKRGKLAVILLWKVIFTIFWHKRGVFWNMIYKQKLLKDGRSYVEKGEAVRYFYTDCVSGRRVCVISDTQFNGHLQGDRIAAACAAIYSLPHCLVCFIRTDGYQRGDGIQSQKERADFSQGRAFDLRDKSCGEFYVEHNFLQFPQVFICLYMAFIPFIHYNQDDY